MGRSLLTALGRTLLHDPDDHEPVHFHAGPTGDPAVCYDRHCPNPRLSRVGRASRLPRRGGGQRLK